MNNKKIKEWFLAPIIHSCLWVGGYLAIQIIFSDSDCKMAYGLMIGWAGALYLGYFLNISLVSIIPG